MKIVIFGGSGFIGKNLIQYLSCSGIYTILHPSRNEVNLTDKDKVNEYFKTERPDFIINAAGSDKDSFEDMVRSYFNLARQNVDMVYFGSGAEGRNTDYGLAKEIMNEHTWKTKHIYNLRLYGVYGKYEDVSRRFISHCIISKIQGKQVRIFNNLSFDYLYVNDLCKAVKWFLENTPNQSAYNVCSGNHVKLSQIADIIRVDYTIDHESDEVYGSNSRQFLHETGMELTPLDKGIGELIKYYEKTGF